MVRKRHRRRTPHYVIRILIGLLVCACAYVFLASAIQSLTTRYSWSSLWTPRVVDCFMVAWLFWVGSSVGSFLNVVAWRMPRGRSINGLSHCPWCNQRLQARDNWPVFGWIALKGRCRTCRLPISPRYPIVELAVGLTILLVGFVELQRGLSNVPYVDGPFRYGPLAMPTISGSVVAFSLFHAVAIACSWAVGLVRFDGHRLPIRLTIFCILVTAGPLLVWGPLAAVSWRAQWDGSVPQWTLLESLMRLLTSLVAAVLVARTLARYFCPAANPKLDPIGEPTRRLLDLVVMLAIPALVLGWQALLTVVIVAVGIAVVGRQRWGSPRDGLAWFSVSLPVAFALQLAMWSLTERAGWLPSSTAPPWVFLVAGVLILLLPAWLKTPREIPDRADSEAIPSTLPD